jgi:UDP-N-acetylglucosamine 2-epimerase (non-hydrolysing)
MQLLLIAVSTAGFVAAGPVVVVAGTRPEAIKQIPVYEALRKLEIPVVLCSTGQHAQMLDEIFNLYGVQPDVDMRIMKAGQDLFYITEIVLHRCKELFQELQPSMVVVQGDTTSAMAASLGAFYLQIPVAHVEAGLRTGNIYAPFPEEMNRVLISRMATLHFPPTTHAADQLLKEGVDPAVVFVTGNTVIDALYSMREKIAQGKIKPTPSLVSTVEALRAEGCKLMLLTVHRRESWDGGVESIFRAVKAALEADPDLAVIYPMHPNPLIRQLFDQSGLEQIKRLQTMEPLSYGDLVYVLDAVDLIATDSGGIQEEAVSCGKPTLVLRNETDRPEGLAGGLAILVGNHEEAITATIAKVLAFPPLVSGPSPYGDGLAGQRIASIIKAALNQGQIKRIQERNDEK